MIQSCDCQLPAMIETLRGPLQHKSMSITSPECIRHFPSLLWLVDIFSSHAKLTAATLACSNAKKKRLKCMQIMYCALSHMECKAFVAHISCIVSHPCQQYHGWWKWVVAKAHAGWPWCACACTHRSSYIWVFVSLCMHINIDGFVTERQLFLENNRMFLCARLPSASIWGIFLSCGL